MKKRKKRIAALLLTCTLLAGMLPASAAAPSDINGHWAQTTIQNWVSAGRISGYPDGTFKPQSNVSRAEMVKLINKAFSLQSGSAGSFSDVPSSYWGYSEIQIAAANGYVSGDSSGLFRPNSPLTRAEAAVMLSKIKKLDTTQSYNNYSDNGSIPNWAKPHISACALSGVMGGYPDGSFGPTKNLTRAEAVVAIDKALNANVTPNNNNTNNITDLAPKPDAEKDKNKVSDLTVDSAKTYKDGTYKDVDVDVSGATLRDLTVNGDLTINSAVKNGSVTLNKVRVKGDVLVYGGGKNSVVFYDCQIDGDIVSAKTSGETVALKFDSDTSINGDLRIQEDTTLSTTGSGEKPKLPRVSIETKNLKVLVSSNVTVTNMTLEKAATGVSLTIDGTISRFTPEANITVEGAGTISRMDNSSRVTVKGKVTVGNGISVTGVTLDKTTATVAVDKTITLNATIKPSDATTKSVTWSTDNSSIATVSTSGVVTGKKAGTATITAKTDDGNYRATCKVTVTGTAATIAVTGVTLSPTSTSVAVGSTVVLTPTVTPSNASNKAVSWASSNTGVATVNNGTVTGQSVGNATITVTTTDGQKTAICTVNVTAKTSTDVVKSVSLNKTELTLDVGKTETLKATVTSGNATNQTVTWSASGDAATVNSNGVVTAVKAGEAIITATAGGQSASCTVKVNTTVKLDKETLSLKVNDTTTLVATVSDGTTATWESSDSNIADVDISGKVTAKAGGVATITATAGEAKATCTVTVVEVPVEGVEITGADSVVVGSTITLAANVTPNDATDKDVVWSSDNEECATVNNGVVTGHKADKVTITAKVGGKSATHTVTVTTSAE